MVAKNFDSLIVCTDAQSCAGLESPRARVPYMARGEFAPATMMRADALKLERKHYPPAYAARLNRQACQSTTMDSTSAAASMSRTLATIPTESRTPDLMATPAYKKASYTMSHKRLEHYVLEIGSNLDLPKLELLGEHPTLHAGIVAEPLPCGELLAPNRSDSGPWAAWVSISNPSRSRTSRLLDS